MPTYIIHKDGAYNFFSTVSDDACYERALTLEQVKKITRREHGTNGLIELELRLRRTHETGCSGHGWTLDDCVETNRAGLNEQPLSREMFIKRYLTL